jgi:hypothetical protein
MSVDKTEVEHEAVLKTYELFMYADITSPYNKPPRTQRGSRGIALLIFDLGARKGG